MKMEPVLNIEYWLDRAEKNYLIEGGTEFVFEIRKKSGVENFHFLLEKELLQQSIFRISAMKEVREGFVTVARPSAIKIDLETLVRQRPELPALKDIFAQAAFRCLTFRFSEFCQKNYNLCRKEHQGILECLDILNFLIQNGEQVRGLLPRQIAHGRSTKILGQSSLLLRMYSFWKMKDSVNWDEFFADFGLVQGMPEFRFFSPQAQWQGCELIDFHGVFSEEVKQGWNFPVAGTLILENFESFLSLSKISRKTLLVWGGGWKAVQLEKLWDLLPQPVFYWGDIDKEGLEILNSLAGRVSNKPRPVLMDLETVRKFSHLIQTLEAGPPTLNRKTIEVLSDVYDLVVQKNLRIEQEQIPWTGILDL